VVSARFSEQLKNGAVSPKNVALKTKLPRRHMERSGIVLTPVQVQMLADALREPVRSFTLLLVLTGLRVGELLALRWGSVDLKARLLRVVETVYDGHFDKPKTKRGMRTIPIGSETAEILTVLRPAPVDARSLIFAKSDQTPLDRWNLLRMHLKPTAKKLGLSGVTWHLLRHSTRRCLISGNSLIGRCSLVGAFSTEITISSIVAWLCLRRCQVTPESPNFFAVGFRCCARDSIGLMASDRFWRI